MSPPTNSPKEPIPVEDMTYEQAFNELESIVNDLETDERPLEDALALFERGQTLAHHCAQMLEDAELKVQELSGDDLVDFNLS
ncbi:MAG: exodeoxyribonuclease VII small subunit [Anaerolineales bacterium]|jgi:exodeoxyribonuclease VII small subunit